MVTSTLKDHSCGLAGPHKEDDSLSPVPKDPAEGRSHPDSAKFLIRKIEYPSAIPVHSCFDFGALLDGDDAKSRLFDALRLKKAILRTAQNQPTTYIMDAKPPAQYIKPLTRFFTAAGFNRRSVEFLTDGFESEASAIEEDDLE